MFDSGLSGELDFRITVDYSDIMSDIAQQLSNGISLEQVIEDLWYSVQAEADLLRDDLYQHITEVIMSEKIEHDNNPESTIFPSLQTLEGCYFIYSIPCVFIF